jgi:hypothetical protein
VRHERQGERLIARTLIDAAGQSLVAPLKNPAKKSARFAVSIHSSHADEPFQ